MPAFLELSRISRRFGGVRALDGVDIAVEAGSIHGLVGENGCGKSTLIKIVAGAERPEPGGAICVDGARHAGLTPAESRRLGIQVIYQDLSLFPNLSVAENVAVGRHLGRLRLVDRPALRRVAGDALARMGAGLALDARVGDLSIADRQLVAICRALAEDARLVVMDEPTASLTRHEVDALILRMRELARRGIAVVFVSHRLDEVLEVADTVTVLRDGRTVGTFASRDLDADRLGRLMTGGERHADPVGRPDPATAPVVLEVEGLTRAGHYRDVALRLHAGEILGLTGVLGAGRTELALSLFGMNPPDAGTVRLDGRTLVLRSGREAIAAGIAYVPEDRLACGLALDHSVADNLVVTILDRLCGRLGLIAPGRRGAAVGSWIARLSIKVGDPADAVRTLSGGNQQRVVLGKWMATGPKVLILDSPTVGVDVGARQGIYATMRDLADAGVAILLISDEIAEVMQHADRVLVMRAGRIVGEHRPAGITPADLGRAVHG